MLDSQPAADAQAVRRLGNVVGTPFSYPSGAIRERPWRRFPSCCMRVMLAWYDRSWCRKHVVQVWYERPWCGAPVVLAWFKGASC